MSYIDWLWNHREEIAAWITFVMGSIVAGSHLLVGFARGCARIAQSTTSKADDAPAAALLSFALAIDAFVQKLAALHARLMPRPLDRGGQ